MYAWKRRRTFDMLLPQVAMTEAQSLSYDWRHIASEKEEEKNIIIRRQQQM